MNCKNCGAPITGEKCRYCGTIPDFWQSTCQYERQKQALMMQAQLLNAGLCLPPFSNHNHPHGSLLELGPDEHAQYIQEGIILKTKRRHGIFEAICAKVSV